MNSDLTTWSDEELVEHALSFGTPTYAKLSRRLTEARDSISSLSDFNAELSAANTRLLAAAEAMPEPEYAYWGGLRDGEETIEHEAWEELRAAIEQAKEGQSSTTSVRQIPVPRGLQDTEDIPYGDGYGSDDYA